MSTETEFDYQAYLRRLFCDAENAPGPIIHRGPKARQERREAAKAQISQKDPSDRVWEIIRQIVEKSDQGDYIYRGEPECYPEVSSSLYRQHKEIEVETFNIEVVQKEILTEARKYAHQSDDFEILAELQHYGGKTNLIDFTTDYLIALFYACDGAADKAGRVVLTHKLDDADKRIRQPRNPGNRVIAQKSVFVQPNKGFIAPDAEICIPQDLKQPILEHLRKHHGISTETIYNDLHGFIRHQAIHQSAYTEFYFGLTRQNQNDQAGAIQHYDKALELKPDYAEAYNNRGNAHARKGDPGRAIQDYDKALELKPDYAKAYYNRGLAYARKGDPGRAIQDYDKALELKPDYANAYYNRGIAYARKGDFDRAIQDYDEALELKLDFAEAYYNRGNVYASIGDPDRAIQDYDKALELKPDYAEAYNNRGTAYDDKGDPDRAIQDYDKALKLKPDDAEAYNNRGTAYDSKGDLDRAIQDYDKALELKPDFAEAYYNRGNAYDSKGDLDRAIQDYDKALELKPDLAEVYYNRGSAYGDKGDLDRAIQDYDKALELEPDAEAYYNRGIAYGDKGDPDRAIQDYDKALELEPDDADAYYHRGVAWLCLKSWEKARADLTSAGGMGADVVALFQQEYEGVAGFEQRYDSKLPADLAAMLTPEAGDPV